MQQINFYRNKVAINVLAKDIANAREIYDAAEGHAVIGILSAQFSSVEEGIKEVKRWMTDVPSISVGLGAGDPAQYYKVLISTGVSSSQGTPARVSCDAAVRMMLDSGAHAAKFFPMGGERSLPELYALATTAARNGMTLIEPTGGIDLDNFGVILQSCLEAGVLRVSAIGHFCPYVCFMLFSSC